MPGVDEASEIRPGEELPRDALLAFLQKELGAARNSVAPASALHIQQFPGGYSNLTYLVRYGDRELVLRRPPFGSKVKSAHDMGREFRILTRLAAVYPRAPRPIVFCEDASLLGAPFYLMERISGLILRKELPPGFGLGPSGMRALCASFLHTLVELHAIDYQAAGLAELGKPEGYVLRQVTGWSKRYRDAQTDEIPAIEEVMAWLGAHLPPSPQPTFIHNDYKFDNLVLSAAQPTRIIGVLDWEMATIGDPLMDLGTALCYWVQPTDPAALVAAAFGPTAQPGCLSRRELCDLYAAQSGRDLAHIVFYYCFGLFKSAVVVQQIYYRYRQGLTQDPRFAALGHLARVLIEHAAATLSRNAI